MTNSRFLEVMAGVMVVVGAIGLVDGYAEYAAGEENLVRWLMLSVAMFLIGGAMLRRSRNKDRVNEGDNA